MCDSKEAIYPAVNSAVASGLKVVVGGVVTAEIAPRLKLKFVRLSTGKEAVIESIEKAKETVRVSRAKQAEAQRFKIILDLESNGILSIDENKIVTVFNPAAEEITGIKGEEIIGKSIEQFFPNHALLDNLKTAESSLGGRCKLWNEDDRKQ